MNVTKKRSKTKRVSGAAAMAKAGARVRASRAEAVAQKGSCASAMRKKANEAWQTAGLEEDDEEDGEEPEMGSPARPGAHTPVTLISKS